MKNASVKKNLKDAALFLLVVALLIIPLSACTQTESGADTTEQTAEPSVTKTATEAPAQTAAPEEESDEIIFPLEEPATLTYWIYLNTQTAKSLTSYSEMLLYEQLEQLTGVTIEFQHPAIGQETDQFNIMVASNNLPDLVYYAWTGYSGGIEKAYQDGVATPINDLLEVYAPNFSILMAEKPEIQKELATDAGTIYYFPCLYEGDLLTVWYGPQIRGDWLETLGLEAPETIDEWHEVLTAFKEQDPNGNGEADEIPFVCKNALGVTYSGYAFLGAWNINSGFYNDNGIVRYGAVQPEFEQWLTVMRQWYEEGLIDPDFASTDSTGFKAKITGNVAGSYYGSCSGNLGKYMTALQDTDDSFTLIGVQFPSLTAGDTNVLGGKEGVVTGSGTAITSASANPELSAKWLDYLYGEEGNTLVNYGVEGVTYYTLNDGTIYYANDIVNNSDGLSVGDALSKYSHVTVGGPFVENEHFWELLLVFPEQTAAIGEWSKAENNTQMPSSITISADDSQTIANILSEVETYVNEMVTKYIMGQESLDSFDDFVATIEGMNIDEAIAIEQAALDNYLLR